MCYNFDKKKKKDKADQNLLNTSLELTPCPINYETPSVKEISPSVNITIRLLMKILCEI